ncbi:MAG: hypothetical protein H6807_16605 [Planctomycetes bacterium]|nr:hypothetical protein [Planctomycetota bacterium]
MKDRHKLGLLGLALIAMVVVVAVVLRPDADEGLDPKRPGIATPTTMDEGLGGAARRVAAPIDESPVMARDQSAPAATPAPTPLADLKLVVLGLDDQPWPEQDGRLEAVVADPGGHERSIALTVRAGQASLAGLATAPVRYGDLRLEPSGRIAVPEAREPWDGTLRLLPRVEVQVLDARDRHELRGVALHFDEAWSFSSVRPSSFAKASVLASGDSPLVIDVRHAGTQATHWLMAEGYAATAIHFDARTEGRRLALLEGGGRLEVAILGDPTGIPAELRPSLRLRPPELPDFGAVIAETAWSGEPAVVFEHIEAGRYSCRLESGEAWMRPLVCAESVIAIEAGTTTRLELRPELDALRLTLVTVKGELRYPPGATLPGFIMVSFCREGENSKLPLRRVTEYSHERRSERSLALPELRLLPGRYRVQADDQEFEVEVPPTGLENLVLEREYAADEVEIVVRDAGTGEILPDQSLSWSGPGASGECRWDADRKVHLAALPTGRISFESWGRHGMRQVELERQAADGRLEIRLPRGQSIVVKLVCDGLVLPQSHSLQLAIEDEQGRPVRISSSVDDGETTTRHMDRPGHYRLGLVAAPPGYRVKQTIEFDLADDETMILTLELEPEP